VTAFVLRRLASVLPTLLGITLVAFLILNLLPSDPLLTWSEGAAAPSAEAAARLRAELGTDRGPLARYLDWLGALLRLDLGHSLRDGRPVVTIVGEALPWTVLLNLGALAAIYGLAIPCGLLGAVAPRSPAGRLADIVLLAFYALPPFAAALLLQQWLAVRLRLLPLQGVGGAEDSGGPIDLLRHLVLPVTCLALGGWAFVARYARALFRSAMSRDYLATARAKGVRPLRAALHVAANAAVPLVTLLAAILPGLVGGSVLVEQIFSWPGVGRLYLTTIEARDYPVVMALTLLSGVTVLAAQVLVDLLYLAIDPRTRDALLETADD
jgi:peptide/nickel transport system permease protein